MKKLMVAMTVAAVCAGCLSISNNIGDSAIALAAGCGTNAVASAVSETPTSNGVIRVQSQAAGGLVIINNANQPKYISPVTDLKIPVTE